MPAKPTDTTIQGKSLTVFRQAVIFEVIAILPLTSVCTLPKKCFSYNKTPAGNAGGCFFQ